MYSTQNIISAIDPAISTFIEDRPNGGKVLRVTQVQEETISNLAFLTNTDQNNNYLYLEDFKVYIQTRSSPIDIPGIVETTVNAYRKSDINSYLQRNRTHFPFDAANFKGLNFNQFIDQYTALQPTSLNTTGYPKFYEMVLNPDCVMPLTSGSFFTGTNPGLSLPVSSTGQLVTGTANSSA